MQTQVQAPVALPRIVLPAEWEKARAELLVKEKAATHARDALAAERRQLPMVKIDKSYVFTGPDGKTPRYLVAPPRRVLIAGEDERKRRRCRAAITACAHVRSV